jgi:pimeloyl-ACP methyl ester carboxylesterase
MYRKKMFSAFWVLFLAILLSGCSFHRLKMDLAAIQGLKSVSGVVTGASGQDNPIVVILLAADEVGLSGYSVVHQDGRFSFQRPFGRYYLFAYEDTNRNSTYEEDEPVAIYGKTPLVDLGSDLDYDEITLALMPYDEANIPDELRQAPRDELERQFVWQEKMLGEVTTLDNPDFCHENAVLGLWQPVTFYQEYGMRVCFLEPYDPEKIPVLFVHGAVGNPGNWKEMISHMDRSRFQPWVLYYPSGGQLGWLGETLSLYMEELRMRYPFDRLVVVCHSMGGLVGWSAINRFDGHNKQCRVPLYITFATPWAGHESAAVGVEYAPEVVPSWRDMSPGSPFLEELYKTPLPGGTKHYLFFAYRGRPGMSFKSQNTDGTVALKSQLLGSVQDSAFRVRGVDAGHADILMNNEAIEHFNQILQGLLAEK